MKYTEKYKADNSGFNYEFKTTLPKEDTPKVGKGIGAVVAFIFTNIIFMVFAVIKLIRLDAYTAYNILFFALTVSFCVFFSAAAVFFVYRYLFITIIKSGYKHMTPMFRSVSLILAEQYAKDEHFGDKINKVFDMAGASGKFYDKNTPWIVKKAVSFILSRLPFVKFLKNLSPELKSKDIRAVSESIYFQMDQYMLKELFANNNMKWIFFLFPANVIVQLVLLHFVK